MHTLEVQVENLVVNLALLGFCLSFLGWCFAPLLRRPLPLLLFPVQLELLFTKIEEIEGQRLQTDHLVRLGRDAALRNIRGHLAYAILLRRNPAHSLHHLQLSLHYLFLIVYYLLDLLPCVEVLEIVVGATMRYLLRVVSTLSCKLAQIRMTLLVRRSVRRR